MSVTVEFTVLDEFLAELAARPPAPEPLVRITTEWRLGETP